MLCDIGNDWCVLIDSCYTRCLKIVSKIVQITNIAHVKFEFNLLYIISIMNVQRWRLVEGNFNDFPYQIRGGTQFSSDKLQTQTALGF